MINSLLIFLDVFIQLVVHCRLSKLLEESPRDEALVKYNRRHLMQFFDALHTKDRFIGHISINDFPRRTVAIHRMKDAPLNLNEDSDGLLALSDGDITDDEDLIYNGEYEYIKHDDTLG